MNRFWQQLAIATNWPALVAVGFLSSIGALSIWADEPVDGKRQVMYLCIAMVVMAVFQMIDYRHIGRWAWGLYFFSMLLLLYTILPVSHYRGLFGVPERNGTYAWIDLKYMSFQPAELMKISFVMVLARYLRFRENYRTLTGLLAPFALALLPVALILKQPDLGTALVFIPALFAMLFMAGAKIKHLLAVAGMGIAVTPIIWLSGPAPDGPNLPVLRYLPTLVRPYQRERVYAVFSDDPATLKNKGYQTHRAQIALGSGGMSGKGLGNIPVGKHVPEGHNDMIFALIGEQFGFFGSAAVLGAYVVLFAAGIEIAGSTKEPFGRLLAVGIVSILAGQTFINLMVAVKLMPVTGITLPFVSYGGSSLLASFMAAGLLLNVGQNRPLVIARESFEY